MKVVTDLHLHSKYSRAVSPQMTLPHMSHVAKQKGLDLLSASDFTHPVWFKEIRDVLKEAGDGVYTLKQMANGEGQMVTSTQTPTYFILSTEIACIYKHKDKLRRIHNLLFVPSIEVAEKVTAALLKKGANLSADGRPIIGLSSRNLLELLLTVDERCFLIPCHIWTPHFGIYGNASGYDNLEEAFEDLTPYIYGIETGLSSDPGMNWSVNELRTRSIMSFSDAHSAPKMGREATVFELEELSFTKLKEAMNRNTETATNRLAYTIEFYPEEGKYHYSGHRNCKISYGPEDISTKGTICPVCHRKITEGVLVRVQQLANEPVSHRLKVTEDENGLQWFTDTKSQHPPYVKLVPLLEIIAESVHTSVGSKKAQAMYTSLLEKCGSELDLLLKVPITEIVRGSNEQIAMGVKKVRAGDIVIEPGYDGEYGKVSIWRDEKGENENNKSQLKLDF